MWRGGRLRSEGGYIRVLVNPEDFFYPMANPKNYVLEHRLIMAKHLQRRLLSWEVVHHRNGIRDDNRLENLQLLPSQSHHVPYIIMEKKIRRLETRIAYLETENGELRNQKGDIYD